MPENSAMPSVPTAKAMAGAGRVRHPSYWRGRIEELLSTPDVPRHVRTLSEAVLAKIDAMEMRFATMK